MNACMELLRFSTSNKVKNHWAKLMAGTFKYNWMHTQNKFQSESLARLTVAGFHQQVYRKPDFVINEFLLFGEHSGISTTTIHAMKSSSDSCWINQNQIVFTIFEYIWSQTKFCLIKNQSDKCNYNQNLVWFNNIMNLISLVCNKYQGHAKTPVYTGWFLKFLILKHE